MRMTIVLTISLDQQEKVENGNCPLHPQLNQHHLGNIVYVLTVTQI